jgi:carbohydrate kinase (thermoresistant glucokinase family)
LACSALKKSYRNILRHGLTSGNSSAENQPLSVAFVYLKGSHELIQQRMSKRTDHYMPVSLLASQFSALEEPGEDEIAITISTEGSVDTIVQSILKYWKQHWKPHLD